jgi:hypothetical protein
MKREILIALLTISSSFGGVVTQVQADACLKNNNNTVGGCVGGPSGTQQLGADFNTFAESALAGYGKLQVSASSTFSVTNGFAESLGIVSFTDDLTITSPGHPNGTLGILHPGYTIDGSSSSTGGGNAFLQVVARDIDITTNPGNPSTLVNYVIDYNSSVNGSFTVPSAFPFIYGKKFELYISLQATAGSITDDGHHGYSLMPRTAAGSGTADYSHTLVLTQLQTNDGSDNRVTDSTITSDSGTAYTQDGVVPEPGTWALVGLSIPAIIVLRRRR